MFGFGELNYESSRAVADDEEEDIAENQFGLAVEWTEEGQKYLDGVEQGAHLFSAFVGKVALGLGEGFSKGSQNSSLLGQVFMTGNEGTVDLCSKRPKRKPCVKIFLGGNSTPVIFALVDFYSVPRFLSNELLTKISKLINMASEVILFHSEVSVYNRSDDNNGGGIDGESSKLYYLASSKYPKLDKVEWLSPPNIVSGPSAAILTHCEMALKPALMLITYSETELVDSISLQPFFKVLSSWSTHQPGQRGTDLGKLFSQFQHNIRQFVEISNLYA